MSVQVQHRRDTNTNVEANTPAAGELWFDTSKSEMSMGTGALLAGVRMAKKNLKESLAPAQITANTNDYNPTGLKHAGILFVSVDAAHDLTGLVPTTTGDTTDGREIEIYNTGGSNSLTLRNQSSSSSAANRFDLGGSDIVLAPSTNVKLRYSNTESRWQLCASTVGSAPAAGGVLARTLAPSSQGMSMVNGTIVESHSAGATTFAIKTLAGGDPSTTDPVLVIVRDATLGAGDFSVMTITAATLLVISSGSSLGTTNGAAFRLWLVGFNDAGTFRLGVINALAGVNALLLLTPDQLASSTAEGGSGNADSLATFYTGTAVTSKPYAVLGFADYPSGQATAGTWASSPTTLQLYHSAIPLPGRGVSAQIRNTGFTLANGTIAQSVTAGALTLAIKTLAGNDPSATDPVYVLFRDATAGAGDFTVMQITAATSITIASGATLGTSISTAFRIWLVGFNDGGTFRLGVINCLSGSSIYPLGQFPIASSTLTPGNSPQVIYTTGAAVTSQPYAVLGYLTWESGINVSWTAPSRIQLFGQGSPLPGQRVSSQRFDTGAVATGTTVLPKDDSIPQSSEGDQYMSLAVTPNSGANLLDVAAVLQLSSSGATFNMAAALFRDSGANALAVAEQYGAAGSAQTRVSISTRQLAAASSSSTFKVRAGTSSSSTVTFNGAAGARLYANLFNSYLQVEELMT